MRFGEVWPHARTAVVLISGIIVTVLLATQVGGAREFLAISIVAAAALTLAAVAVPVWLLGLGAFLVFAGGYSFAGIPLPEVGALMIIIGVLMSNRFKWQLQSLLVFAFPMLLIWVVFIGSADIGDPVVNKRLLSLVLWVSLVVVLSLPGGALSPIARGLLVGLFASLPASLVFGSGYGDRGAGLVGDPNAFAMVAVIATPLIVGQLKLTRWKAALVWLVSALLVVLADSRTGMASLLIAALVFHLLPLLHRWAMGIPLLAIFVSSRIPDDAVQGGRWEERAGSDELRQRIDAASSRQIADSPWTGHGLGSGSVDLSLYGDPPEDLQFFLHNSYKSIVTEMGVIGLGLYFAIALGAIWQALHGQMNRGALAAIAGAAVMATQLGEVLFAIPVALAFGFAWASDVPTDPNALPRALDSTRNAPWTTQPAATFS